MITGFHAEKEPRAKEIKELIAGFHAEKEPRAKEIRELIAGFRKERVEAAAAWQELLERMSSVKAPKAPHVKKVVPEEVPPVIEEAPEEVKPAVEAAPEEEKLPVEEAPKEKPLEEMTKEEQIIHVLSGHPDGLTLPDIAKIIGVHFVTLSAPIKKLEGEGKVVKIDNLYLLEE